MQQCERVHVEKKVRVIAFCRIRAEYRATPLSNDRKLRIIGLGDG